MTRFMFITESQSSSSRLQKLQPKKVKCATSKVVHPRPRDRASFGKISHFFEFLVPFTLPNKAIHEILLYFFFISIKKRGPFLFTDIVSLVVPLVQRLRASCTVHRMNRCRSFLRDFYCPKINISILHFTRDLN